MRNITKEELKEILELHRQWLENKETGERADLTGANLRGFNLTGVDLSYANLIGVDLWGADLRDSCLSCANLTGSNLRNANLSCADLKGTNLIGAGLIEVDLSYANLEYSDLNGVCLYGSDLTGANLRSANLSGVYLRSADLSHANLTGANLYYARLKGVQNIYMAITDEETKFLNNQCPKEGEFIGWKKCYRILYGNRDYEYIVKLLIPSDSKRSSSTTKKCRCSKATVLAIYDMNGKEIIDKEFEVYSHHDETFKYKVGQTVTPNRFDKDWWNECSNGIHFFMERESAEKY